MNKTASEILTRARELHRGRDLDVIVIDGRSGSGKSSLTTALISAWGSAGTGATSGASVPQVLPVEALYPGWDGLAAGAAAVAGTLARAEYRRYDWHAAAFTNTVTLDPSRPLIIEGCGALTGATLRAVQGWGNGRVWSLWLAAEAAGRRERALARDGETFRPYWDMWAEQEAEHLRAHRPVARAREIVHFGE